MQLPLRRRPVEVDLPEFGISAFVSRHAPHFEMPWCAHPYQKICLVEDGWGELQTESRASELRPGVLIRVPPASVHRFVDRPNTPMTLSALCINAQALRTPSTVSELWDALTDSLPEISQRQVATEYERSVCGRLLRAIVLELGRDLPHRAVSIYALTVNLLVVLVRTLDAGQDVETPGAPESFAASLAELEDRFTEELRIEDLAKRAGMSYRSYTSHFRRCKGMTVTQYVTQRRIEFAKRRMLETEDILGSSLEAGFHDLSHFYRVFKRLEGETPLAFIERHSLTAEDANSLP